MRNPWFQIISWILLTLTTAVTTHTQFSMGGQLMLRGEYRHGYGKLIVKNQEAAFAIGQRARVNALYDHEKVKFLVSARH